MYGVMMRSGGVHGFVCWRSGLPPCLPALLLPFLYACVYARIGCFVCVPSLFAVGTAGSVLS